MSSSTNSLVDVVRHYQRSIEKHGEDEKRLLHCVTKLFNLPIKFEHLQETGIGKTVNSLRKINGEVGVAAKTLVTKWKAMVVAVEEPTPEPATEEELAKSNGRRHSDEDPEQENKGSNSSIGEDANGSTHRKSKEDSSKSSKREKSKSHSKSKSGDENKHKHKSSRHEKKDKDKSKEAKESKEPKETKEPKTHSEKKSNGEHKSKDSSKSSSSNSGHKSSKSEGHKGEHSKSKHDKDKSSKESSKHSKHKSSSSKSGKRSHSPTRTEDDTQKAKIPKIKAKSEEDSADGFDSSMGANFDDVLGMLNVPISSKKSSHSSSKTKLAPKTTPAPASSSTSSTPQASATLGTTPTISKPTSTKKPELLAPTAKLEPLDPSIALELPTISNNYKPMPLNQTVMDVVFNQGGSQRPQPSRYFNESEALAQGISSKTMRTKIYSGVRTGQILQVPSLFNLCIRVLQKNIDGLEFTGGVPFDLLRPVLERATPQQLLNFEEYNPYLMDDSDVLWKQHVQRHCRSQQREEMETWREMFLRCQEEKERKLSSLAESIKASQKISEAPVRKTQLAFVDSMVKPPRSVQRKQEQYGTRGKLIATPAARVASLSSVTPNAAKVGDARLRVLAAARDTAQVAAAPMRSKKAPLMAKTLQFMRGRHKR
ncbi:transcription elongation factor B polypeptide 3 [Drosophila bipectinata]|uniref:transcription elongation factor B polypeptide 3 n=1 Tax=Drosophila bipectinata TaxID=42026 RepID=UPI001C8A56B8|nr:transcription elongation factor B polypeptide 3 [Drosophila bipectinata]